METALSARYVNRASNTTPSEILHQDWTSHKTASTSQRQAQLLGMAVPYGASNSDLQVMIKSALTVELPEAFGYGVNLYNTYMPTKSAYRVIPERTIYKKNRYVDEISRINITGDYESVDAVNKIQSELYVSLMSNPEETTNNLLDLINSNKVSSDLIAIICDALGRFEQPVIKTISLNILTKLLTNKDYYVREACILGLALLDDTRAIPALEKSSEKEKRSVLKNTILDVIQQINS